MRFLGDLLVVYLGDQTRSRYDMSWVSRTFHVLIIHYYSTTRPYTKTSTPFLHPSQLATSEYQQPFYSPHTSGQDWYQIITIQTSPTHKVRYEGGETSHSYYFAEICAPGTMVHTRHLGLEMEDEGEGERERGGRRGASDGILYII